MSKITIEVEDFSLKCVWDKNTILRAQSKEVLFSFSLPAGALIQSSQLTFTTNSPLHGADVKRVNGIEFDLKATNTIDVDVTSTPFSAQFEFKSYEDTTSGTGILNITEIALTIEYIIPAAEFSLDKSSLFAGESLSATIALRYDDFHYRYDVTMGAFTKNCVANDADPTVLQMELDMLNQIPNSTSGVVTIKLVTLDASDTEVGSTEKTITLNCPDNIVPDAGSIEVAGTNLYGSRFVQGLSSAKITASGYSGVYGSTIKSIAITGAGYSGTSPLSTGVLQTSGTIEFVSTVIDSRGKSSSTTTSIEVQEYYAPSIVSFSAERCNADNTSNAQGQYAHVYIDYSYYDGDDENQLSAVVKYRESSASLWQIAYQGELSTGTANFLSTADLFEINQSYDITVELTDSYGKRASASAEIGTGYIYMRWEPQNNVISQGSYPLAGVSKCLQLASDWSQIIGTHNLFDIVYPVGAVFSTTSSDSPGNTLGGIWELIGTETIGTHTVYTWTKTSAVSALLL